MVIAAVVCGPGSILTSSKIGAQLGYGAVWVLALACLLMIGMVSLSTRIGIEFNDTPCGELARRKGRPLAAAVGIIMFLIIASFQASNNIAIAAALEAFDVEAPKALSATLLIAINGAIIAFLYLSRNLYGVIENAMKILVLLMVVAFLINCVIAKPSLVETAKGLIPSSPGKHSWLLVALVGTTFSVAAAFYQAYLAREKGWSKKDKDQSARMIDTVVGVMTLGGISLVIMMTNAAVFYGQENTPELKSAADVALQLQPLFGSWAQFVFGVGILAGALSSFLVNALIGGHILADGFGLGDRIDSPWTRHFTTAALLTGMSFGLFSLSTGVGLGNLIIFAQALTVIGVPALGITLIYLGWVKRQENPNAIPIWILSLACAGFLATCLIAVRTIIVIIIKVTAS